jgi:hypothetical protein
MSMNMVIVPTRQATQRGGINSLESIFGLLTSLKMRALVCVFFVPTDVKYEHDVSFSFAYVMGEREYADCGMQSIHIL